MYKQLFSLSINKVSKRRVKYSQEVYLIQFIVLKILRMLRFITPLRFSNLSTVLLGHSQMKGRKKLKLGFLSVTLNYVYM